MSDSAVFPGFDAEASDGEPLGPHCAVTGPAPTITGSPDCPQGKGPPMIRVGAFCIDATEVTNAQYDAFLNAGFPKSSQPAACAGNESFRPTKTGGSSPDVPHCPYLFDPVGKPNHPVPCVDWCDAWSFCRWSGKRLCGAIGGGATTSRTELDGTTSEWLYACTGGSAGQYPYGSTFDPVACQTNDCPDKQLAVSTARGCHGANPPFDQIFDMIGNNEEWVDACDGNTGMDDTCTARGYSTGGVANWPMTGQQQTCGGIITARRGIEISDSTGIRCCADPIETATDAGPADGGSDGSPDSD